MSPAYSHPVAGITPLIWKEHIIIAVSKPLTPGSSIQTNDIDCNCLPCEGAPLSYVWFDFNLNLKVWSQTGQDISGTHFSRCLGFAARCGWGTRDNTVAAKAERGYITSSNRPLHIPPQARMWALTLKERQCRAYASDLYRINNRMIFWQSVQLLRFVVGLALRRQQCQSSGWDCREMWNWSSKLASQ